MRPPPSNRHQSLTSFSRGPDSGRCGELVGIEAGAADERTVDVRLGHELGDVLGLHRAAVLDAHRRAVSPPQKWRPPAGCVHTAWASSAVAVRPVPIAQIGS